MRRFVSALSYLGVLLFPLTPAMLANQAHTLKEQARLAVTLAWVGGYTNVVCLIAIGTVSSHMSGTASALGQELARHNWEPAAHAALLLGSFFSGSMLSGAMLEIGRRRHWRSIYVLPIVVEVALLVLFAVGLAVYNHAPPTERLALYWIGGTAAMAMGLQNATITRISSGVVRTTHVTGVLTDIGLNGVHWVWEWWKKSARIPLSSVPEVTAREVRTPTGRHLLLLFAIFCSFIFGTMAGAIVFDWRPDLSMFLPAAFLVWLIYRNVTAPFAEIVPVSFLEEPVQDAVASLREIPAGGILLYRLELQGEGTRRDHRPPNFQLWAEGLPKETEVVVLDVAGLNVLDQNASIDLREAKRTLRARGKRLVLAGVGPDQLKTLRDSDLFVTLEPANVCPDLQSALLRAASIIAERSR